MAVALVQAFDQTADEAAGQVCFEGPGGVGIAKNKGQVGQTRQHHAFVAQGVFEGDGPPVD